MADSGDDCPMAPNSAPTPSEADWQRMRAYLNHDVLQNRLLSAIRAALAGLPHPDASFLSRCRGFRERAGEFEVLLDSASSALDPRSWVESYFATRLPADTVSWLASFASSRYGESRIVSDDVVTARDELRLALAAAERISDTGGEVEVRAREVETAVGRLSAAISRLPHSAPEALRRVLSAAS